MDDGDRGMDDEAAHRLQHDARTPLNVIMGHAQLIELEAGRADPSTHARAILSAGQDLLRLLGALDEPPGR